MWNQRDQAAKTVACLRERFDSALPIFVLIDPLLGEPATPTRIDSGTLDAIAARGLIWNRLIAPIRLCGSIALPIHQHPYLVALEGHQDPLLEFTVDLALDEGSQAMAYGLGGSGGGPHRIGGWLQSDLSVNQLAELVAAMCDLRPTVPTAPRYLRIADRRAIGLIRYLVGDLRFASHIAGLQQWRYLDPTGTLAGVDNNTSPRAPLFFGKEEWKALRRSEGIHRTMHQWLGELEQIDGRAGKIDLNRACQDFCVRGRF